MITREEAVSRVAARLPTDAARAAFTQAVRVRDLGFGWLVRHGPPPEGRSDAPDRGIGSMGDRGAHLVDAETGALFFVLAVDLVDDAWLEGFLFHHKGRHVPDAVETRVRDVLAVGGRMAALRELRKLAPSLDLDGARRYVDARQNGESPPRTLPPPSTGVGQLEPLPSAVDLHGLGHMWTTDRAQWYIVTGRHGGAVPIRRGAEESALLMCNERVANTVVALMVEAGVEVVVMSD